MLTVENGTSEVTEELLEKVRLLRRDLVETVLLATGLNIVAGKTSPELGVEVCDAKLAKCSSSRCSSRMQQDGWFGGASLHDCLHRACRHRIASRQELEHRPPLRKPPNVRTKLNK
jgi:hypothetical protein